MLNLINSSKFNNFRKQTDFATKVCKYKRKINHKQKGEKLFITFKNSDIRDCGGLKAIRGWEIWAETNSRKITIYNYKPWGNVPDNLQPFETFK